MWIINIILLIIGFIILGRGFGVLTVYCSMLLSFLTWLFEKVIPLSKPLTDQPFLELQHVGSAIGHRDINLRVQRGEIVGLYGLVGAGRSEAMMALFGLKDHANGLGVRIIGDLPIYVSLDSADVWSERREFLLDKAGRPSRVATSMPSPSAVTCPTSVK